MQWNTTHKRPNRPAYLPRWLASLLLNDSTSIRQAVAFRCLVANCLCLVVEGERQVAIAIERISSGQRVQAVDQSVVAIAERTPATLRRAQQLLGLR